MVHVRRNLGHVQGQCQEPTPWAGKPQTLGETGKQVHRMPGPVVDVCGETAWELKPQRRPRTGAPGSGPVRTGRGRHLGNGKMWLRGGEEILQQFIPGILTNYPQKT